MYENIHFQTAIVQSASLLGNNKFKNIKIYTFCYIYNININ